MAVRALPHLPLTACLFAFASLVAGADYQIQANIRYDQYPETVLDILQPPAPALKNRPGVIVIHGGGIHGDKEGMVERFCLPFIQHDFVVANVEYRLAAGNDVLKAAQWFRDHAADYKVDPNRILVMGASEGGRLALMVAMTPESIKIAAVILFDNVTSLPLPDVRKGLPPVLAIHGEEMSKLWPQVFKWLKKRKFD